ncbi:ALG3 protein-domain-containing protein [Lipomyces japonicus]|uniref:ALG3 protein-domain-containing protein n=1 Tax=Lipomyces japonicus TaxID=56871 RepID=UPI0034D00CDD
MHLKLVTTKAWNLATGSRYSWEWAIALWLVDLVLTVLIVYNIPYTEIDWRAYMEQVQMFLNGERNYAKIRGGTGPLVSRYPAGHVYIFSILNKITNNGENILKAQIIFAILYLSTLALVFASYLKAKAPLYSFPLVILSKRLHSIYMLRLFNDGFAMFVVYISTLTFQSHYWFVGSIVYSLAVSIKMNVLLFLPAVAVILLQALGSKSFRAIMVMLQVQIIVAYPFTSKFFVSYVTRAFEFHRIFNYKWTVNWKFLNEEVFLAPEFAQTLLFLQGNVLLFFIFTRWIKPSNMSIVGIIQTILFPMRRPAAIQHAIESKLTAEYLLKTLYTCNLIGVLFARSLHYQFYAWFAWSTPYLLSVTNLHPLAQLVIWIAQEWSWNVFPSTVISSAVGVICNATVVIGIWFGTKRDVAQPSGLAGGPPVSPELSTIEVKESTPVVPASTFLRSNRPRTKTRKR